MDLQMLFNALMSVVFFALGGLGKVFWDTLKTLREQLGSLAESVQKIEHNLPETYVRRDDFKEHASRVLLVLDRIESKLDQKQDK